MADSIREKALRFDWQRVEPLHAALCLPVVALSLVLGTHYGYPGTSVLMAGGAMCVGFGSFQKPLIWRWGPMLASAIGIAISAAVGTFERDHALVLAATVVVWSFLYGLSDAMGPAASWVGLQCCVYLVISSAAPASLDTQHSVLWQGILRGSGMLAGGLLQMGFIVLMWRWVPRSPSTYTDSQFDPNRLHPAVMLGEITQRTEAYRFAVRIVITAICAMTAYHYAHFNNAYWIPMTALLVPKPDFYDTATRTVLRIGGTIAGAALCTFLIVAVHPAGETLSVLVTIFLFGCFCMMNVNYGAFALFITGYIVFILAIVHAPTQATILHRVGATAIGGCIALLIDVIFHAWAGWKKNRVPAQD